MSALQSLYNNNIIIVRILELYNCLEKHNERNYRYKK